MKQEKSKDLSYFLVGTISRLGLFVVFQSLFYLILFFQSLPIYAEGLILFIFFLPLFYLFSLRWLLEEVEDYKLSQRIFSRIGSSSALRECKRLIRIKLFVIVHISSAMAFVINIYIKYGVEFTTTLVNLIILLSIMVFPTFYLLALQKLLKQAK